MSDIQGGVTWDNAHHFWAMLQFSSPLPHHFYDAAQRTLMCYLKTTNYTLLLVDLDKDPLVQRGCSNHSNLFFKKHCAAAMYLPETDWMLVLDADTGVVNPNHCIEEWIDDRVDVLLYERFFNWEVAAGNYLVKNSDFGRKFLREFAKYEFKLPKSWHGHDQGGLMMVLLELLLPHATSEYTVCEEYWKTATDYNTYMAVVICVREALGAERADFMFHGWKQNSVQQWDSPFEYDLEPNQCGNGYEGWRWRPEKRLSVEEIRQVLDVRRRKT
ncbi:hypothetical protein ANCCEY_00699 [Ancylostoma ceylanicum]|uniref:Nucleotide-diphospho-sugar transferase domain-containing protein n=1 Tax=Ancylostoma ceylanicum TaxID=53326 RepID=A0A0D6M7K4_9BILA|nr:hypothetical protein ANCCEY_00699 [Ancylostoma ceylanicum]